MLSLLHHPNLVNLIGYCADGDQRILVYEYMALGSLEDHLLGMGLDIFYVLCRVLFRIFFSTNIILTHGYQLIVHVITITFFCRFAAE